MNRLIGLIIVVSAIVGAATAWRFPFSWNRNSSTNQLEAVKDATATQGSSDQPVKSANSSTQKTAQAPNTTQKTAQAPNSTQKTAQAPNSTQKTAQAPQTVGQAGTGTPSPAPGEDTEPITGLW